MNDDQERWAREVTDTLDRLPCEVAKLVLGSRAVAGEREVLSSVPLGAGQRSDVGIFRLRSFGSRLTSFDLRTSPCACPA